MTDDRDPLRWCTIGPVWRMLAVALVAAISVSSAMILLNP